MRLNSLEEILRFAVRKEADAAAFYRMAAERSNPGVKKAFGELALQEESHRQKIEALDPKKIKKAELTPVGSLGIADWMEDVPFSPDMDYSSILRMAVKNEERSERLYSSTAQSTGDPQLKKLLTALAEEETKHKKRLEKIYDDEVLTEM